MATNFEVSPESRVLRRYYDQLLNAIANYNPLEIAVEAHSRGVLPRDWIGLTGGTPVQKTHELLSAVSVRVKENSQMFYQFVELLKAHPPLIQRAVLMEQSCWEECSGSNTSASYLAAATQQSYMKFQWMQQIQQQWQQLQLRQQLQLQQQQQLVAATSLLTSDGHPHFSHGYGHMFSHHPSVSAMAATGLAASHIPQSVLTTSSLPLQQGSNLQPLHSLSSHNALASRYPPGIHTPSIDTSTVPDIRPGVPATPCQTSDGQPHFSHGDPHMYSHHPSVSSMAATVGTGLAASHIPQPGSSLQPQHSLSSHTTLASSYPPGINIPGMDTAAVPGPGGTYMSQPHYPVPATPFQTSDGHPHFSHGDHHISSLHPSVSAMAAQGLAASLIPQSVPITSSLPLQGTNLQPQHSLGSHNILASGHPPGINARDIDTSMVPGPGGMYMSQPHFAVPTASSLPLQGSNLQSQHILSSHSTLASRYPPVPTASPLPLQGSNLLPQHSLGSHGSHASRYPPNITTSVDTSTVSGPSGQDVLTLNELYDVLNELHVVRAKWHLLGGSLRLKESVLAAIRAEFRDIPDNCLREMLSYWLKQVTPRPCWSAIVAALRMPIVYEPQLAQTLKAKYCPGNISFQSQHSHGADGNYLHQGYSSQESNPCIGSGDISMLEERPPSLKIPRISSGPEKIQPLSSGATLSQQHESVSTGRELSTLPVEGSHPPRKKQNLQVQNAESPFNAFGEKVKSIYIQRQDIPQDDWPPVRKSQYINLALLNSAAMKDNQYSRYTIRGCIDDILKDKEEIQFPQVFVDVEMGCRILFEGRPGSGKTTLMQKISKKWAEGQIIKQATVFILIPLRVFVGDNDNIMTLQDIVGFYQPPCLDSLCKAIEQNDGQGLCICIDGLDEYSPAVQKKNYIHKLVKRQVLSKAVVIVASRPSASQKFRRDVDRNVEVLGFLKPQIHEYITDYYSHNSAKAEGLIAYLEEHPNVKHACYLPLHLAMVAYLYDHTRTGASLPERETEIYRHFTLSTLARVLFREQEVMDSEGVAPLISEFKSLPPEKYQTFMKVCELAFKATVQQKQVYSLKEAKDHFIMDPQGQYLGLITVDRQYALYGREETYSFLHLTLQEFLAAYHLMQLKEDLISVAEQYTRKAHMFVVFKFYFGLTQVKTPAAVELFKRFVDANKSNQLLLLQCAFESKNTKTCQLLASKGDGIIDIQEKTLNPSDFTALGYVAITASSALHETRIISCSITSEGLQALVKTTAGCSYPGEKLNLHGTRLKNVATADFLNKASSVTHLRLSKCGIPFATLSQLAPALAEMKSLVSLRLEQNEFGRVKSTPVVMDIMKMLTNLEHFSIDYRFLEDLQHFFANSKSLKRITIFDKIKVMDVSRSYTSEKNSEYLMLLLSQPSMAVLSGLCTTWLEPIELRVSIADSHSTGEVKHLNLKEIQLDVLGSSRKPMNSHILSKLIEVCPNLMVLSLGHNNLGPDGAKSLCLGLKHCTSLQTLDLRNNVIGDSGGAALGEVLKNCPELQVLALTDNNIGPDGARTLCLGLKHCTSLQTLNLEGNSIGESGGATLGEVLKNCPELQVLVLGYNNLGPDGVKSLCLGLKPCTSLQTLNLSHNSIGPDGAKSLCLGLKHCTSLQTLNLYQNKITDEATDNLAEVLQTLKDLKQLDLGYNNLGPDGAKSLCLGLKPCTSLQTLNLWGNDITDDAVDSLMELLKTMKDLKKLNLGGNNFTESGERTLRQAAEARKEQITLSV